MRSRSQPPEFHTRECARGVAPDWPIGRSQPQPTESQPEPTEASRKPTKANRKPAEGQPKANRKPTEANRKRTESQPKPTESLPKANRSQPKPTEANRTCRAEKTIFPQILQILKKCRKNRYGPQKFGNFKVDALKGEKCKENIKFDDFGQIVCPT